MRIFYVFDIKNHDIIFYEKSEYKRHLKFYKVTTKRYYTNDDHKEKINYKKQGLKHSELHIAKFFKNYYLPEKFNIDKRRLQLFSQILPESPTRNEALRELKKSLCDEI